MFNLKSLSAGSALGILAISLLPAAADEVSAEGEAGRSPTLAPCPQMDQRLELIPTNGETSGNDQITVYEENWKEIGKIPSPSRNTVPPPYRDTECISVDNHDDGDRVWLFR